MIAKGNTVKVHYTGKLENNEVFDSSLEREPIEFKVGDKQVIEGFENAVIGLNKGDKTTVTIEPEQAYGEVNEDLFMTIQRTQVPPDVQIGSSLQGVGQNGEPFNVVVREIKENEVVVDGNHQLSGKKLIFEIEVVDFQ